MKLEIIVDEKGCRQKYNGTIMEVMAMLAAATELILRHLAAESGIPKEALKTMYLLGLHEGDDDVKENTANNLDCSFSNFNF